MLNDITFGQYFPGNSIVHRLNPAVKIILCTAFIVLCFLANNAVSLIICFIFIYALVSVTKIPLKMYLRTLKPIIPIILFTSVLNALYVKDGTLLIEWWKISITSGGILTAIYMSLRISLLIVISSMLTYTTSPTELADAIEKLLSPFKLLKLDIHSLSMMMTIALRFIPILIEETDKIMSAQKARGADMESGGLKKRVKALLPVFIPLLISSFRRAGELADAMECRCYHGGEGRTKMNKTPVLTRDVLSFFVTAIFFVLVIYADRGLDSFILNIITRAI